MEIMVEDVVIVGAGLAGLATAVGLKRVGVRALVLESYDGLRASGSALTLSKNAWFALDALGVSHKLTSLYSPCQKGRRTNIETGIVHEFSFTGRNGKGICPVPAHRKALLEALAEELPTDSIRFSSKVAAIETQEEEGSSIAILRLEDGTIIKAKVLIGCDGVHSVVARWLGLAATANSCRSAARGLAVYPQGHGLEQEMQQMKDAGKTAGFVPVNDKEVYWYITCESPPKGAEMTRNPEFIQREVIENYAKNFPQKYLDVVRHSDLSTVTWSPLIFRYPWHIIFGNLNKGNITVAGDAMHPMTPDIGQGGCAALEDAVVLARHVGNSLIVNGRILPRDMTRPLKGYVAERRWRAAWLVTVSYSMYWVQQRENKYWGMKFFMTFIQGIMAISFSRITQHNCGNLPSVISSDKFDKSRKIY